MPTGHNAVLQQGEMYVANGSVSGGARYKKYTATWSILEIISNYLLISIKLLLFFYIQIVF